jgi:sugar lactone lactonase YvrE
LLLLLLLLQGFYYANGVALSSDESFLVLAETDRLRAHKVWLKGPKVSWLETI